MPEFTHAGIHNRIPGYSAFPGAAVSVVLEPGKGSVFGPKGLSGGVREVMQKVIGKFTPCELTQKRFNLFRTSLLRDCIPDLSGRYFPEVQMGREPGSASPIRPIPVNGIESCRLAGKGGQLAMGAVFARAPILPNPFCPVRSGEQAEVIDLDAGRPRRRREQLCRGGERRWYRYQLLESSIKGRKHFVRPPGLGSNTIRFVKEWSSENLAPNPALGQATLP
jgi:hypothetical protein